jgi:hypothetical protein
MSDYRIFHGDHTSASRQALNQAIKAEQGREIIKLDGSKLIDTDLRQALESQSLFGQEKLVVIYRLPLKLIDTLTEHQGNTPVFIWHDKALTPTQVKKLSNFKPQLFKIPAAIFNFLDQLNISTFHQALTTDAPEQIFYMLHRRLSQLIQAKDSPQDLKLADWQKSRLITQAKRFTLDQLLTLHFKLLTIDEAVKTGRNFLPLDRTLELWLLNL